MHTRYPALPLPRLERVRWTLWHSRTVASSQRLRRSLDLVVHCESFKQVCLAFVRCLLPVAARPSAGALLRVRTSRTRANSTGFTARHATANIGNDTIDEVVGARCMCALDCDISAAKRCEELQRASHGHKQADPPIIASSAHLTTFVL